MKEVSIFTDGSALPTNPGFGGWAAILSNSKGKTELCGGYRWTTNNRMEIMAVLKGLESLQEPCEIKVFSDSSYVVNAINDWMYRWERKGWRRKDGALLNADLWKRMFELARVHVIRAIWIRGHNGHVENERADALANGSAYLEPTEIDFEYERLIKRG